MIPSVVFLFFGISIGLIIGRYKGKAQWAMGYEQGHRKGLSEGYWDGVDVQRNRWTHEVERMARAAIHATTSKMQECVTYHLQVKREQGSGGDIGSETIKLVTSFRVSPKERPQ